MTGIDPGGLLLEKSTCYVYIHHGPTRKRSTLYERAVEMSAFHNMRLIIVSGVLAVFTLAYLVPQEAMADVDRAVRQAADAKEDAKREKKDAKGDVKRDIRH